MPKFTVTCQSKKKAPEAFVQVRQILEDDQELKKLDSKITFSFDDKRLSGSAKGSHFRADLIVLSQENGSSVDIIVDLPFHLALAKGIVQKTLQKKLDEVLLA